jgi:hypothetical protein
VKTKIPLPLLFLLLLTLAASVASAAGPAQDPEAEREARLQAWSEAVARIEALGDPRDSFQPNVYYVDELGAYYFDEEYNLIHTAAGSPEATRPSRSGRHLAGAMKATCWQFTFSQIGSFFPNPSGGATTVKANVNLLVLGTDFQFYPATITSRVTNVLGQLVKNTTIGTFNSNPNFQITVWDGKNSSGQTVASGNYFIQVTATTSICGTKSFSGQVTRIN